MHICAWMHDCRQLQPLMSTKTHAYRGEGCATRCDAYASASHLKPGANTSCQKYPQNEASACACACTRAYMRMHTHARAHTQCASTSEASRLLNITLLRIVRGSIRWYTQKPYAQLAPQLAPACPCCCTPVGCISTSTYALFCNPLCHIISLHSLSLSWLNKHSCSISFAHHGMHAALLL